MTQYLTEAFPDPEPEYQVGFKQILWEILQTVMIAVVLFAGINAVSARIRVKSISMQPTLYEKDYVIVNKLAYRLGKPGRGDVIIFYYPPDPTSEPYIKRVIGLPGETVRVSGGEVYVNDEPLQEYYIKAPPVYNGVWTVPEGALFVLGDNRNFSSDSHQWGMVPFENVIGKAELVYFPLQHWQVLNPATAAAAGQ